MVEQLKAKPAHGEISNEYLVDLLRVIRINYGYDFSGYAEASLKRRITRFCQIANLTLYNLKFQLTNDKAFFYWMLDSLTVNVTEMFRDPDFYLSLYTKVFPMLSTYPTLRIWIAGCSSGEEAYSMAILLQEAGLLNRCKIYATDINPYNIEKASKGIIPLHYMKSYTLNYLRSGGTADFSAYYTAKYNNAIIAKELRRNILFAQHNLVTDYIFNEFQLILCRNVLIYFKRELQNHTIHLFHKSLSPLGYLVLGTKESLVYSDLASNFNVVDRRERIYRLMK